MPSDYQSGEEKDNHLQTIIPMMVLFLKKRQSLFSHDHQVQDPLVRVTETHHGMKTLIQMMQHAELCIVKVMMMLMMTMKMVLTKSK